METTPTTRQPLPENSNKADQKSNASLAYPFPVMRAGGTTSSSISDTHDSHSSNQH